MSYLLAIKISVIFLQLIHVNKATEVQQSCISSLTQSDCEKGEVLVYDNFGCPQCQGGVGICGDCSVDKCAPGLKCEEILETGTARCAFDKSNCHHLLHMDVQWHPECLPDGTYAAKQCRGDKVSGRCFCFSSEGKRIFGWDWRSKEEDMTCSCSRQKSDLEKRGVIQTLHCTQNGNFEEVQCTDGICWCSKSDGSLKVGTVMVPENLKSLLPCHNSSFYGDSYLRRCNSIDHAQNTLSKYFELHGTKDVPHEIVNCDQDGSYGVNAVVGTQVICTARSGSKIGNFYGTLAELGLMQCPCARDSIIFEQNGINNQLICESRGSYESVQHLGVRSFCVDSMGYSVTDYMDDTRPECSKYLYDQIDTIEYCARQNK